MSLIFRKWLTALMCVLLLEGCSVDKYIPDGGYYLKGVMVSSDDKEATKSYSLSNYIAQQPNSNWFGAKVPMRLYCLSGTDTTRWSCRFWRKLGEAPRIYDPALAEKSSESLKRMLDNEGYMKSSVELIPHTDGNRLVMEYHVVPRERYVVGTLRHDINNPSIERLLMGNDSSHSLVNPGMPFTINALNEERKRVNKLLRDNGFFHFNRNDISFQADTCKGSNKVALTMTIGPYVANRRTDPAPHRTYTVGDVTFLTDYVNPDGVADTVWRKGHTFVSQGKRHFRDNLLIENTAIRPHALYSEEDYRKTLTNFSRLEAISYSNVRFTERATGDTIDAQVIANHAKPKSVSFELEGTNSAGDLGAAASASFQHRNLFRGSELLTFKLRGAYEAITGLEGYEGHNYTEVGAESRLNFPNFLFPFINRSFGRSLNASSEIALQYNLQNRPEFYRRVLTAAWRYRWNSLNRKWTNRYDLLEINYVYMPWISRTFRDQYLDNPNTTNAILKYNYENLLITKMGYSFHYNSLGISNTSTYGKNALTLRGNIETSGNVLNVFSHLTHAGKNASGQYEFCNIAFAQYVKGDIEVARSHQIDNNNSIAYHAAFGIAYPYANGKVLPFEKRYFAGGANGVRGWAVRSLGPGAYNGKDNGINFINQSGDIKLDASLEYRAFLFWKFSGALFVDAGNIWTIRDYEDQPGGVFKLDEFHRQIAVSYGLGIRMALDFFVLRFDGGMKAIDPAYRGRHHYPIAHPKMSRDFAFHFAVGLPF